MSEVLKVRMEVWDGGRLLMQILKQDKSIVNIPSFYSSNGIEVITGEDVTGPSISEREITLRGSNVKTDLSVRHMNCENEENALAQKEEFETALKEYVEECRVKHLNNRIEQPNPNILSF